MRPKHERSVRELFGKDKRMASYPLIYKWEKWKTGVYTIIVFIKSIGAGTTNRNPTQSQ